MATVAREAGRLRAENPLAWRFLESDPLVIAWITHIVDVRQTRESPAMVLEDTFPTEDPGDRSLVQEFARFVAAITWRNFWLGWFLNVDGIKLLQDHPPEPCPYFLAAPAEALSRLANFLIQTFGENDTWLKQWADPEAEPPVPLETAVP